MNFANNEMMIITSLLFQQFELELVTKNPQVNYSMGASRPEKTIVRYARKTNSNASSSEDTSTTGADAYPHAKLAAELPRQPRQERQLAATFGAWDIAHK